MTWFIWKTQFGGMFYFYTVPCKYYQYTFPNTLGSLFKSDMDTSHMVTHGRNPRWVRQGSSRCSSVTYWVWENHRLHRTLFQTSKQNSIERGRDGPFTYQKYASKSSTEWLRECQSLGDSMGRECSTWLSCLICLEAGHEASLWQSCNWLRNWITGWQLCL